MREEVSEEVREVERKRERGGGSRGRERERIFIRSDNAFHNVTCFPMGSLQYGEREGGGRKRERDRERDPGKKR